GAGLATSAGHVRLTPEQQKALAGTSHDRVSVGIRPARLMLASDDGAGAEVLLHGMVEAVEMLGAEQYVHFVVEAGALTARVPRERAVKAGQNVVFTTESKHLYLFDQKSGVTLR